MDPRHTLVGQSRVIQELVTEAQHVAATDSKVLLTGESGVGKEVFASLIHRQSGRSRAPLVTINCAGVPDSLLESELFGHMRGSFTHAHKDRLGLLEVADGGTVLLDEVAEMSIRMQTLLLRFLENGEIQRVGSERMQSIVNVRVISATNRDLLEMSRRNEFRSDLYYRLNVVHLIIPALRERPEDIRPLLEHYVDLASASLRMPACKLESCALARLEAHPWPGNVRELRNVAERLVLRYSGRSVSATNLPAPFVTSETPAVTIRQPAAAPTPDSIAGVCFERMTRSRESFWTVVHEPFMQRDLTRDTVRGVVRRGLENTRGSYRLVAELFNLPASDYKRFLNFLQKHECHMPFEPFRAIPQKVDDRPSYHKASAL